MMKKTEIAGKGKRSFWRDETGEVGVKQIAITVGVIVLVGLSITIIQGKMGQWLDDIWGIFTKYINEITG